MDRRTFLRNTGIACGSTLLLPSALSLAGEAAGENIIPPMRFSWQGLKTTRPFAADCDTDGKIWFGSSERFFTYDPELRTTKMVDITPLGGKPCSASLCQGDKVYILTQKSPDLFAYHRSTGEFTTHPLPDPESNIWYGVRVPGDPRLYLYVRNRSKLVVWDSELDRGKEISYPETMDLWSGFYVPGDHALYSFTLDAKPCRVVRFDLKTQRFDAIVPAPESGLEITGVNPVGESIYCADRFTGRIFPFDFVHRKWKSPLHAPGHRSVYSFIGMGTSYRGKAYYCLSTYKGTMKYDFNTNRYLSKADENIGIDGRPHHFLNKYLVLDPVSRQFDFLEAPAVPGKRYPLICYSIVAGGRLIITGYDLGDVGHGLAPMGERQGELCVMQSIDQE
jgi:hypothetical protein